MHERGKTHGSFYIEPVLLLQLMEGVYNTHICSFAQPHVDSTDPSLRAYPAALLREPVSDGYNLSEQFRVYVDNCPAYTPDVYGPSNIPMNKVNPVNRRAFVICYKSSNIVSTFMHCHKCSRELT